ncbi:hypothetical protein EMCRGX_G008962 [Ephydatia muelleri]
MSIPALQMSLFRVGTEERKPAAFGITVTSSLTPAILNEASMAVGAAAFAAEFRKHAANDAKCQELGCPCPPVSQRPDAEFKLPSDLSLMSILRSFPKLTAAGPLGCSRAPQSTPPKRMEARGLISQLEQVNLVDPLGCPGPSSSLGGYCKLVHLAHSMPSSLSSKAFSLFDDDIRRAFNQCMGVDTSNIAWEQAQLSLKRGGLGLLSLSHHSSAAFISSICSSGFGSQSRLRTVLQHLAAASFTLKASKCHSKSKIKYLGHIVSKQGIRKDPDKVSAMLEFPVPTDLKQFVDLSRHYSRFIKGFSSIAEPLHKLSRKMATDASGTAIGAVLSQDVEGQIEADSGLDVEGSRTRPADILLPNWEFGKPAALDFTITSALNPSTLNEASVMAGSAASAAEVRKHVANDEKCSRLGWVCIPLSVETYGCWGEEAGRCLDRLATRIATRTGCPKSSAVSGLYGRLSIGLIRANARALLARSSSLS